MRIQDIDPKNVKKSNRGSDLLLFTTKRKSNVFHKANGNFQTMVFGLKVLEILHCYAGKGM